MSTARAIYKARLEELSQNVPEEIERQADWAKYLSILVSGYLEQSIREILLEFANCHNTDRLYQYIDKTWPKSRNMSYENIRQILNQFDQNWGDHFRHWIDSNDQYKSELEALITSRNNIAHGNTANTTNVTLPNARTRLRIAIEIVECIENLILPKAQAA